MKGSMSIHLSRASFKIKVMLFEHLITWQPKFYKENDGLTKNQSNGEKVKIKCEYERESCNKSCQKLIV